MEPFEKDELSERELDGLLPAWKAPPAPARLRAAVFPEGNKPWWRAFWTASFRVPVPAACGLAIMLALAAWRSLQPAANAHELRPVAEVHLRIIRSPNAQN